ncbi:amino acid adenylation domain-containing protein [Nonomuraea sp. NPDC050451]|uniref:amino acid adenylation domain-containing protein n=1 Tax=Nonomuraea sp. NPDC050451 TaxID=3364364 RepID=UPI00379FFE4E
MIRRPNGATTNRDAKVSTEHAEPRTVTAASGQELSPAKRALLARLRQGEAATAPAIPRLESNGPLPLSYAQERVWFADRLDPDKRAFNLVTAARGVAFESGPEVEGLLAAIVARHDVLRTSIRMVDEEPKLFIADSVPIRVPVRDCSGEHGADPEAIARREAVAIGRREYDLERAPLWRVELVKLPGDEMMLVLAAHHVIVDGTSFQLFGFELAGLLQEAAPQVRFADFTSWQRERAESGGFRTELDYWRKRLDNLPAPLELPADRRRPVRSTFDGATIGMSVPQHTVRAVRALAKETGATPYLTLLASFVALLHRWTGERDVVIGSSTSGRTRPEVERMLGVFNNVMVLRTRLNADLSFRDLLDRVKEEVTEGFGHQEVPYEYLVRELGGGTGGLVNVCFNMPTDQAAPNMLDLPISLDGSHFDLTGHVRAEPDGELRMEFEYSLELFDESTVRRLLEQYLGLIDELVTLPDRPVAQAPMPVSVVDGPHSEIPGTLPELVLAQARQTPQATAVISGGDTLTYAELVRRARATSAALRARGVRAGTAVGVRLARGLDLPVTVLGTWLAGGVYVPLDPALPDGRSRLIVEETRAVVIDAAHDVSGAAPDVTEIGAGPGSPAYIVYTSGSTGRPKGAVVTHAGIANRALWAVREHGFGPGDRMLHKTRISFDAHVWELFAPLISGGAVVMAPPGAEEDPETLLRAVADHQVSVLQVVPSVLRLLVDVSWDGCESLRLLFCAGEPLHAELCRRVFAHRPDIRLINTYGPTECAIDVSAHVVDPSQTEGPIPIGRPIDGLRLLVLGPAGRPVPPLAPGDLYVAGPAVGLGYLSRPELTAEAFVPDPTGHGRRLYRTGDRARLRADGVLEFLGRRDHQVKINGVRVEPEEIAAVLARHPDVQAAVVTAREGRLTAYVTGAATHDDLRAHLREQLPAPMVPGRFVTLDRLPLNASGKVDQAALPEPESLRPGGRPPGGPVEERIGEIWAELLGLDTPAGAHDDFFTLGGHSLLMTRLGMRLRREFGVELPLRELLSAGTVARQAALVSVGDGAASPVPPARRDLPMPLSPGQRRLWFLDRMEPGSTQYVVPLLLRLRGRLDADRLERALTEVVRRHEVLRTRYDVADAADQDPEPVQIVMPAAPVPLRRAEGPLPAVLEEELGRPFDLATGCVLRAVLVAEGSDRQVLALLVHHIACDGWSLEILARELGAIYAGESPAPPPIQFGDLAVWERDTRGDGQREEALLAYWRERLGESPVMELPIDRPRPAEFTGEGAVSGFLVPASLAARLREIGRARAATPFMTLLAPFLVMLSRYSRVADTVVGTPLAGRVRPETENLIGFFANTLVLRTDLAGDPTFTELLERVRTTVLDAYAHQELPFERLVEELVQRRDLSRNPLFQIMFEMNDGAGAMSPAFGDVSAERVIEMPWHTAKFDLTLSVERCPDGRLQCWFEYATSLFDAATIERMTGHYLRLLESIAADPDAPVSALDMMTDDERRVLLHEWPDPQADRLDLLDPPEGRHLSVQALFERQVRRTPDAVAVVCGERRLTYAELNRSANRLARHLRAAGVGPETVVAVCLERGLDAVVALMGVLKSGGAYVPFDPGHPAERLNFMLADARAKVVVTQRRFGDLFDGGAHRLVVVDADEEWTGGTDPGGPPVIVRPDGLAYIIYTSGSTGRPKGVMIEHRSYAHHCQVIADAYDIGPGDRVVLLSALTFDVAMDQMAATLLAGATIVVGDPMFWTPAELPARLAEHQVTIMEITPAYYRELMASDVTGLTGLKLMNVGSDVVTVSDARTWARTGLPARFLCNYGPTEATVTCLLHPVDGADAGDREEAALPIGRPMAGTRAYVVDAGFQPVPVGVPGELCLAGVRLARGYYERPELTAERFVPDPFGLVPGGRLYRTGDLVRYLEDGTIEFLGRIDQQVKIRGFRIELGEIESALAGHPAVRAVAVVSRRAPDGDQRLVAYLVFHDGPPPAAGELRAHLRDLLPEYMIPAHWVTLDALPLTPSKKVDRKALPAIGPDLTPTASPPPRTPVEQRIAEIWSAVLGIDDIGIGQDFFELGGHSLRATRVHSRIQEAFGIELPLRRMFEATTVEELARVVHAEVEATVAALSDEEIAALLKLEEPQ